MYRVDRNDYYSVFQLKRNFLHGIKCIFKEIFRMVEWLSKQGGANKTIANKNGETAVILAEKMYSEVDDSNADKKNIRKRILDIIKEN